jgi:SAM-dependent methyltransferase
MSLSSYFDTIYKEERWGKGSGEGSCLHNCSTYIAYLIEFIHQNKIQSIVDFGCGDWQYMQHIPLDGINYTGIDVAPSLIEKNKTLFPNVKFECKNIVEESSPPADLMICKEVFQHLSNEDILMILPQVKRYKYCLITNDFGPNNRVVKQQEGFDYEPLDLLSPPFNLTGKVVLEWIIGKSIKRLILLQSFGV